MSRRNVIILGAAGRDFHNFNVFYRNDQRFNVVAFTATQIPDIDGRHYPPQLAGELYPAGIPVYPEEELSHLIEDNDVHECVFSYSDVSYEKVMAVSAIVQAAGASFVLLGPDDTMLKSGKPVVAVCAVRTGCGKSQTSRRVIELLMQKGLKVIAIRHPMPYGDLVRQKVQRFASLQDLSYYQCTIEEMEEYEPHITRGNVIYAGVDYGEVLRAAERDDNGCDVIVWDGGNNDFPFIRPDVLITVTDPHRVGHETGYYPGEVNVRMADVVIINKIDSAEKKDVEKLRENIRKLNPSATVVDADSPIRVDNPDVIRGKDVLVIEDGPTLTHGEMKFGAGIVAAREFGASRLVDPRPFLRGKLKSTFEKYPDIGTLLPAMGYGAEQLKDLEDTINDVPCDGVIIATPIDLSRELNIIKPCTRVYYDLREIGEPDLNGILEAFMIKKGLKNTI